ncbi:hypothetical protein ABN263_11985, partial [Klebsiella pasteurii]
RATEWRVILYHRPNSKSLLNEQAFLRLSPVKAPSTASGNFSDSALGSPVAADALPGGGLRVHRCLRAGSPDRCAASPPGKYAAC